MPSCILCGREATETPADGGMQISCPEFCREYTLGAELADLIPKQSDQFRADLARAVQWYFYRREPGEPPVTLPNLFAAQSLIASLEIFEEDPKALERTAVKTLIAADCVPDAWHEPIIELSRELGLPIDKARAYAKNLEAREIVHIVPCYQSLPLPPGEQHFGKLEQWARCEDRSSAPEPKVD